MQFRGVKVVLRDGLEVTDQTKKDIYSAWIDLQNLHRTQPGDQYKSMYAGNGGWKVSSLAGVDNIKILGYPPVEPEPEEKPKIKIRELQIITYYPAFKAYNSSGELIGYVVCKKNGFNEARIFIPKEDLIDILKEDAEGFDYFDEADAVEELLKYKGLPTPVYFLYPQVENYTVSAYQNSYEYTRNNTANLECVMSYWAVEYLSYFRDWVINIDCDVFCDPSYQEWQTEYRYYANRTLEAAYNFQVNTFRDGALRLTHSKTGDKLGDVEPDESIPYNYDKNAVHTNETTHGSKTKSVVTDFETHLESGGACGVGTWNSCQWVTVNREGSYDWAEELIDALTWSYPYETCAELAAAKSAQFNDDSVTHPGSYDFTAAWLGTYARGWGKDLAWYAAWMFTYQGSDTEADGAWEESWDTVLFTLNGETKDSGIQLPAAEDYDSIYYYAGNYGNNKYYLIEEVLNSFGLYCARAEYDGKEITFAYANQKDGEIEWFLTEQSEEVALANVSGADQDVYVKFGEYELVKEYRHLVTEEYYV